MLRIIFWVVVIVLFLSFFGISIQGLIEDPTTQTNFDFIWDLFEEGWNAIWGLVSGFVEAVVGFIMSFIPS
jgi:hypothetical protein